MSTFRKIDIKWFVNRNILNAREVLDVFRFVSSVVTSHKLKQW